MEFPCTPAGPDSYRSTITRFMSIKQDYIRLLRNTLTDYYRPQREYVVKAELGKFVIAKVREIDREEGRRWPLYAETMIGIKRMDNLQYCIETVIRDSVPGDFIETGVWRGGACIFVRGLFKAHDVTDRTVWVADSFAGLPAPDGRYAKDKGNKLFTKKELAITLETVQNNFEKYGLLDDKVKFLKGWFKDTLPTAQIEKLAVLRLDGDMYASTMDALNNLYPKLSPGGFCIIDDYSLWRCAEAVNDFRRDQGITEEMHKIDYTGMFWRKQS